MVILNQKYVFHVPLYKYVSQEIVLIEMGDILDDLICKFNENGIESFYITKINSYYKTRQFDELLITVFSSDEVLLEIFEAWFRKHNDVLAQEAFAYEIGNSMVIKEL